MVISYQFSVLSSNVASFQFSVFSRQSMPPDCSFIPKSPPCCHSEERSDEESALGQQLEQILHFAQDDKKRRTVT
jgi:hypothetical protein